MERALRRPFSWRLPVFVAVPFLKTPQGHTFKSPFLFAIALDTNTQGGNGTGSPLTSSVTCTGSNLILYQSIGVNTPSDVITAASYNSVAMTRSNIATYSFGGGSAYLYRLIAPATGTNTLSCTKSSGFGTQTSASYSGVAQTGQPDSSNTATTGAGTTTDLTASTTVVASNCWLVAALENNGGTPSGGTGTTLRQLGANVQNALFDSNGVVGTGSQSLISHIGAANAMCMCIESFSPVSGGGTTSKVAPLFSLMGVGAQ